MLQLKIEIKDVNNFLFDKIKTWEIIILTVITLMNLYK